MKEVNDIQVNQFGEVSSVQPSVGIFLKEEYYSRLPDSYYDAGISFELTYDEALYRVLDRTPDDYEWAFFGSYECVLADPDPWHEVETGCTSICTVNDNRAFTHISEQSPYYNTFSAQFGHISWCTTDDNMVRYCGWTNVQVSRVIGTLKLFPE